MLLAVAFANEPVPTDSVETPTTTSAMGSVLFDSRLPAEISIDRHMVAQTYIGAKVRVNASVGEHTVKIVTNGQPKLLDIEITQAGTVLVLIGRTGVTTGFQLEAPPGEEGSLTKAQLRVAGQRDVMLQIGDQRFRLNPGSTEDVELAVGRHKVSVRSGDGTVIWATGTLEVKTNEPVVVQLAEGRMPEVSGSGSVFFPGS